MDKNEAQAKANILLVDDDPGKLLALRSVLEEVGENLITAVSGEEALKHLLTQDFAVILLDVNMPGLDGFETATLIRQRPSSEKTPIIFVSAYHQTDLDALHGYSLGAVDYIFTPLAPTVLKAKVQVFVDLHRMTQEVRRQAEQLAGANQELAQRMTESEKRKREVTLVNHLSELLQSCQQCHETYPIISQFAQELFSTRSGALFIPDSSRNLLEAKVSWGETLAGETVFAPEDCWRLRQEEHHLAVADQRPQCRHLAGAMVNNYLCLPLLAQGKTLGMVHLQDLREWTGEQSESLKQLAMTFAGHISLALSNLRLRESLRYQAIHDPLTGLFNRRYLEGTLKREIHRMERKKAPLGVIMLDLDHFKHFNDTHGHVAGDKLLRTLGCFLQTRVRQEDVACRYGGEEFVLILPEAERDVCLDRAEAIREQVPHMQVFLENRLLDGATISAGVAIFPEDGASAEELLQAADAAMYQAKAAGRDRVVLAETIDLKSLARKGNSG